MDTKFKRRALAVVMLGGALWVFVRRPFVVLAFCAALYFKAESWLGVRPLSALEILQVLSGAPEVAVAGAGVLVAMASVIAFRNVKRLDLELAAAASISVVIRDTGALLVRNRLYCEHLLEARDLYFACFDGETASFAERTSARRDRDVSWACLLDTTDQARKDRAEIWVLVRRIIDLNDQHVPIIRTSIIVPWLLERAQENLEVLAAATVFVTPERDSKITEFMPAFFLNGVKDAADYLCVDDKHRLKVLAYLGGAASIGSTSVAPVSLVTAVRMFAKIWRI